MDKPKREPTYFPESNWIMSAKEEDERFRAIEGDACFAGNKPIP
jgi:hypothetical protein